MSCCLSQVGGIQGFLFSTFRVFISLQSVVVCVAVVGVYVAGDAGIGVDDVVVVDYYVYA